MILTTNFYSNACVGERVMWNKHQIRQSTSRHQLLSPSPPPIPPFRSLVSHQTPSTHVSFPIFFGEPSSPDDGGSTPVLVLATTTTTRPGHHRRRASAMHAGRRARWHSTRWAVTACMPLSGRTQPKQWLKIMIFNIIYDQKDKILDQKIIFTTR